MRARHDPVQVLRYALRVGDTRLADLLTRRLDGRRRRAAAPTMGAAQTVRRLSRWLAGRPRV